MGSTLGPKLTNIFMVGLENIIIPRLENEIKMWKRYVDDTTCFVKFDSANLMLTILNSFNNNIKVNIEIKEDPVILFLDVLLIKTPNRIHTTLYRNKINSYWHIHWNSFVQVKRKWGTIKTLVHVALNICSLDEYIEIELKRIRFCLNEMNWYPHLRYSKEKQSNQENIFQKSNENGNKLYYLILQYNGLRGKHVINSLSRGCFRNAEHGYDIEKRPYFSTFRTMQKWNPPKQQLNLNFLECENGKTKSKRPLRARTASNAYLE